MRPFEVLERQRTLGSFDTPEGRVTPGSVEKLVLALEDTHAIEAILIGHFGPRVNWALRLDERIARRFGRHPARRWPALQRKIAYETCVSTQVGCALDCQFCASSVVPFVRNLSTEEILREIASVEARIPKGGRLRRVLFAGVGEPLMNYDHVAAATRALDARGVKVKINTVGVLPYLRRLFEERLPVELALSFHAPNDALRAEIMPAGKGYHLDDICALLREAPPSVRFIEAKYLMLDGVNDSLEHARELAALVRGLPLTVCLQIYNRIEERSYRSSSPETVRRFAAALRSEGATVDILNSNIGEDVQGGCGQLRAQVERRRLRVLS